MVFQRMAAAFGGFITVLTGISTVGTLQIQLAELAFAISFLLTIGFLGIVLLLGKYGARSTTTAYW